MRRYYEHIRRRFAFLPRVLAFSLVLLLLAGCFVSLVLTYDYVTVVDANGTRRSLLTASDRPEEIATQAGFALGTHDQTVYTAQSYNVAYVAIQRAFQVSLQADGSTYTDYFVGGTVADLVAKSGVVLGEHDYVEPAPETPLAENLTVKLHRVRFVDELRREEPGDTELENLKAAIAADEEWVDATNGVYDVMYRDKLVNGDVVASQVVEVTPVIEAPRPRPNDSYEFIEGVPCSRIESFDDIEMDANGLPVNYTRVQTGAVCTAYSSSGGRGASGLGLYCGTVAVNPRVIPYGSRMFITSADGKFVYGFAIATDTGGAMMEGRVDLDLYFETNAECYQFGKRQLTVYFLD